MANKVTQKDITNFNELYLTLKTYAAVARATGFSSSTVSKYIEPGYKSVAEKMKNRIVFDKFIKPITVEQIERFKGLKGHWGLMCELSPEEMEGMKILYDEI